MTSDEAQRRVDSVAHWYHRMEVHPGVITPGTCDPLLTLDVLPVPMDCNGLRVLDLGTRDGFFAFEFERRGAEVVAIDPEDPNNSGYQVASDLLGSRVTYMEDNVYALSPETHGRFDIVLFLGLLYHLRHPLLALDRIADVCTGQLFMETEISDARQTAQPIAEFWAGEFSHDPTNWWIPTSVGASDMLRAAGFDVTETVITSDRRAVFIANRSSDDAAAGLRKLDEARSWARLRSDAGVAGDAAHYLRIEG